VPDTPVLLICAPSTGYGGGIERVAAAVERCWPGHCARVDLYRADRIAVPSGNVQVKAGFAARGFREALVARPDIVLSLHVGLLPVARAISRATRSELAMLGVGREVWGSLPRATRRRVQSCDRLLAISSFTAGVLAQRIGMPRDGIAVVALPVDESVLAAAAVAIGDARNRPVLLTVSRVSRQDRYKGHFTIAQSLPRVLEAHPGARWIVAGAGDDLLALQAECRRLGVLDAVSFEGRVPDARLAELYRSACAFVMPSVTDLRSDRPTGEGFGLVYAEAGAFGVPSIASTAGGGAAELVEDGVTGMTVAPGDSAALAAAITEMLADSDLRTRLGTAARARVMGRHVPSRFTEDLRQALAT
jgi:glycosyltransferase involved in cell wall biosynthesis